MKRTSRFLITGLLAVGGAALLADEGMWRLDQLPLETIAKTYGVNLSKQDIERLQSAPVRLLSGSSGGTGTFASANGLILTNHHVALDCIRTSTIAEQDREGADNLIEQGFTAPSQAEELGCRRFKAQIERSTRDVTAELNAVVKPGMEIGQIQQARQAVRSDLERACREQAGPNLTCSVTDFNSGARSLLITYEEYRDIRLVYAPEKQLGYFGGDEMNFRFPRFVSDISTLRAYQGKDGSHGEFNRDNVAVRPTHYLRVTMDGIKDGDFTLVAGFPGNTNRYRESLSASYNLRKGIPDQIKDLETELTLLRRYAAMSPENQVTLQTQIFGLANALKYQQDVLAALKATDVVAQRETREREMMVFFETRPNLKTEYGDVIKAQTAVYANDVEANAELDAALAWIQKPSVLGYASGLYQFALERAKTSDRDREPQFQERNWPDVRQGLLGDDPIIAALEEDVLAMGFERALALKPEQQIPAVKTLAGKVGGTGEPAARARAMARAVLNGSRVESLETRKELVEAPVATFAASTDPAIAFARDLEPSLKDQRGRIRILNEKILRNRSRFANALQALQTLTGTTMYPDANFTLRSTYGKVAGYTDRRGAPVPFATTFSGLFDLSAARKNSGEFALPPKLTDWRKGVGDAAFKTRYAAMPVNFVTTNDITGGNSGSSTLNRRLEIVGLIFDGNEEAMAGDWTFAAGGARALSTDIRFALTVAKEVHKAGWIVEELLGPAQPSR